MATTNSQSDDRKSEPGPASPTGHSNSANRDQEDSDEDGDAQENNNLFISSTISKDDALGKFSKLSKRKDLLWQFNSQLNGDGYLQLNSSGPSVVPPMPTVHRLPQFSLLPPGIPQSGMVPPGMAPPPPGMGRPPNRPRPAGYYKYPDFKANRNLNWRRYLMKKKGLLQRDVGESAKIVVSASASNQNEDCSDTKSSEETSASLSRKGKGLDKGASENDPTGDDEIPGPAGLAESLTDVVEKYLKIDMLDQSGEITVFISYLLDTIEILQSQVRFHQAGTDITSSDNRPRKASEGPKIPRIQLLHRIFCTNYLHHHDRGEFEDAPTLRNTSTEGEGGLICKAEITNLDAYLNQHPDICFVVFKEYNCAAEKNMAYRRLKHVRDSTSVSSDRGERLLLVSPLLQQAIEEVAEFQVYSHPDQNENDDDDDKEMDAPYLFLFHHRKKLRVLAKQEKYKMVLGPLLDYLDKEYEKEYSEAEAMISKGKITATHITKLFKPNQIVISRKAPELLEAAVLNKSPILKGEKVILLGWTWIYDGADLRRGAWRGSIGRFGEKDGEISQLQIHPVDFARQADTDRLTARGNKFWSMRTHCYLRYTGWDDSQGHHYVSIARPSDARFMVDVSTYRLMHGKSRINKDEAESISKIDPWPSKINCNDKLPEDIVILLPSMIEGFNLLEKKWVKLYVEGFCPVDWNKKAFDRLVLDPKTKEMIHALVEVQTMTKRMDDIIAGKGNGLIILLHGSPGTGKTLTAESVAEIAEKPLYRVTCGDIGTEAADVEKYLDTVLYLGKTWDCVLLLDEADVFLEERTMADLQRNSLVSVFLRILEYYDGILILTSNRVGTFDEAFKSRIQLSIHYDNLTKKSRKAIWQNFFDMIEDSPDEDANMPELERRLDELASEEMNGRQIRNALLTARQLAKYRKERLDWEHLSQVIKTSAAFNKYLKAVRGHSDDQWAREEQLR
ncbi:hypothetical protein F5Y15DRAFT_406137 [Xylariaceae sp. FL0016]|nr:hypothetical protein F5Y15DRAFT_406137 [Xylariaceae sp. FL0016]